ncbi:Molybdenum-binding periplasmic protein [Klebsiella pneumoniae]|uniref:Molybdenum-binding periplasmic protein n=1 Tax=Klebsiella pneumoniae TaxID=573 RepID=A0A2X1QMG0_KLEPN|nr:Molybdenum-binding periplasmic protein [Klebsiella pneumoniae]
MANTTLTLLAAGSLRSAFLPLVAHFRQHTGLAVDAQFGPAGLLRERIEAGSPCAVFASAQRGAPAGAAAGGSGAGMPGIASNQLMLTARRSPDNDGLGLAGAAQHAPPAVGDLHAGLRSVGRLYLAAVRPN